MLNTLRFGASLCFQNVLHKQKVALGPLTRLYSDNYWDYSAEYGPHHWNKTWQHDKRQSPINIITKDAKFDKTLSEFLVDNSPTKIHAKNVGINISFPADDNKHIILSGGPLHHRYAFREMHLHWAEASEECPCGGEHAIDGKKYAGEMHIVHWNTELYETEEQALSAHNGLAVLGIFLNADAEYRKNEAFQLFTDAFQKVPYMNDCTSFVASPYTMFPQNTQDYFTYDGSLTTPPLTENVTWVVFPQPVKISMVQLEELNTCFSESKNHVTSNNDKHDKCEKTHALPHIICNNYRPTQPVRDRIVRASFTN